ncbi:MAG TPA: hypothetical protein VFF36_09085, partial [Planctomycetota bacterium]|nr:hypothetical protein [Planctomycetota bacterium]
ATRCDARRLEKKRRWREAEALWSSLGAESNAALCRGRLMLSRGDYRAAAQAFEQAGEQSVALDLSVLAAQQEGDWDGAVALAESGGRPELVARIRKSQRAAAQQTATAEPDGEAAHAGHRARKASARTVQGAQEPEKAPPSADVEQLIAVVHRSPGARSEDLGRLTGIQGPRLAALLRTAVAAGGVTKSGATRGTRYWPPKSG